MAVVKFGPLVEGISGKIGGVVFSKSPGQNVIRANGLQTKVATPRRSAARATMAVVVAAWRALSEEKRNGWNSIAKSGAWDRTSKTGGTIPMSGYNLFMMGNLQRPQAGMALITEPPTEIPLPLGMSTPAQESSLGDSLPIVVTGNFDQFEEGDKILIWATTIYSKSVNSIPAKTMRLVAVTDPSEWTLIPGPPAQAYYELLTPYSLAFGSTPGPGSTFGIGVQYLKEQFGDDDAGDLEDRRKKPVKVKVNP